LEIVYAHAQLTVNPRKSPKFLTHFYKAGSPSTIWQSDYHWSNRLSTKKEERNNSSKTE